MDGTAADDDYRIEVGRRIAQARKEAQMRQEDLARELGVSVRTIYAYESGETPPHRNLRQIADILGRPVDWFRDEPELAVDLADIREAAAETVALLREIREEVRGLRADLKLA